MLPFSTWDEVGVGVRGIGVVVCVGILDGVASEVGSEIVVGNGDGLEILSGLHPPIKKINIIHRIYARMKLYRGR